jgi:uncharacterized iron-regulated protein
MLLGKIRYLARPVAVALALGLAASGCSDKDDSVTNPTAYDYSSLLTSLANDVIVPTYEDLATKAATLHTSIEEFAADPGNQAKLDAAAAAWIAAREPWEKSEGFLFGPAAILSLDPSLDSWPVDRQQLDAVLASSFQLTPDFISQGLGPALRGFHTTEFLLFHDGAPRSAGDVTAREREYLVAVSEVFLNDAVLLRDEWVNGYADEYSNAGESGSRYATQADAVREMIDGMVGICDEVANGKIADPYDQQNTELEESQFSYNSLTDFQNNIRSVQNAYVGAYNSTPGSATLKSLIAGRDAALDTRLSNEIVAAIAAIAAIPEPFHDNLDKATEIEAAQQAIITVLNTLEADVKPVALQ